MSFDYIFGNDKIKLLLTKAINENNILHSYMFIGLNGIGKFLFAKEFAKTILCNSSNHSCNSCNSCTKFNSNNHPDFMVIQPEDGKSIKIEQIRFLQEKIAEKPIISNKKVYIINDSDCMTKESQNCLLKTLEEPPEYAVIILILSNESKLLNTIKSRCTKFSFQSLSNENIAQYFATNNLGTINSNILKLCNGSIGKAIELQDESIGYDNLDSLINNLDQKDIVDIWNSGDILYQSKDNINSLLEYINIILMDKLLDTNDIKYINCIKIVEITKKRLTSNANFDMCIDNLLLKLWEEFNEKYNWS